MTNKQTSIIVKKNYFLRLIDRLRKIESEEDREKRWKRGRVKERDRGEREILKHHRTECGILSGCYAG